MTQRDAVGRAGEELAALHLAALGYAPAARNWRCGEGELDLLMLDGGCLVAVEVKTRRDLRAGHPFEAITETKRRRLRRLLRLAAAERGHAGPLRIDAVAVLLPRSAPARLEHLRGVA